MALQFKHYREILDDWLSYVTAHSSITDINPGSIARDIGEASALEIAQVYLQLQSILNLFSIDKASGEDLDERAQDFGETRIQPTKSVGALTIGDSNLTIASVAYSTLAAPLTAGVSTTAQIQASEWAAFPASGSIVVDRANAVRELIPYTSKTGPDLLNLVGTPTNSHSLGATVAKSTTGTDRPIAQDTIVQTGASPVLQFVTTVAAVLYDGDYQTTNVLAQSKSTGAANNVAGGTINTFASKPFPTATVTNPSNFQGGLDLESDVAFRARIKNDQQALSSSTKLRIETAALGVQISTGQRVISAKLIEPITPGSMMLYISDGTSSYTPTSVNILASEFPIAVAKLGSRRGALKYWPLVANTERLYVSRDRGVTTSVGAGSLVDTTQTWTTNIYAGWKVKDGNNNVFSIVSNTATALVLASGTPQFGSYAIFDGSNTLYGSGGSLMLAGTDYTMNETTGEFELSVAIFPSGLLPNDCVLAYYNGAGAAYSHYDGLLREVQRVINGDPSDLTNYPGVKAAGTKVNITAPTIIVVTVTGTLSSQIGVDELTIRSSVVNTILNYINNLPIGNDVILANIIRAAMSVTGAYDFQLQVPTANVPIDDTQLAKTTVANITVT